jgi:hypothetical protein
MARRDRLIRQALRERFVVTLRSGETFDGLLLDADDKTGPPRRRLRSRRR